MLSWANQPHWISTSRLPVRCAVACSAAYIACGCALAWNDSRPTNSATTSSAAMPSAARAASRSCAAWTKSAQCTPSGMTGSCGRVTVSDVPKRQRSASISLCNNSRTVPATADEVQISASHGITGALSNPAMSCIALCEAVVWVTPHRLYAAGPARSRRRAASPRPGPGRYSVPTLPRPPRSSAASQRASAVASTGAHQGGEFVRQFPGAGVGP